VLSVMPSGRDRERDRTSDSSRLRHSEWQGLSSDPHLQIRGL